MRRVAPLPLLVAILGVTAWGANPTENPVSTPPPLQQLMSGLTNGPGTAIAGEDSFLTATKADLQRLQKNLSTAVEEVSQAAKARHTDYAAQTLELARAIADVSTNYLGDAGPLMRASDELLAKIEANKERLERRAKNPEVTDASRDMCIRALEQVKDKLKKLTGARASLKLVRLDLLEQAKRLADAAETVAIVEETAKDGKAVDAFVRVLGEVGEFAKSLAQRLNEIGGPNPVQLKPVT